MPNKKIRKPLHSRIAKSLRREVLEKMKAGDRLPPERELAERFGVSMVTLRNATLALEQLGLVERLTGKGVYVRDPRLSQCVAIVFGEIAVHPRPLYNKMRQEALLQVFLARAGWQMRSFLRIHEGFPTDGLDGLRMDILNGHVGTIVWDDGDIPLEFERLCRDYFVKLLAGEDVLAIMNYESMIERGLDHLVAAGRRNIGLMASDTRSINIDMREIFLRNLNRLGLESQTDWICDDIMGSEAQVGSRYVERIWKLGGATTPDGLLVLDDVIYRKVLRELIHLGIRIPADLSIVAHANDEDDFLHPYPVTLLVNSVENHVKTSADSILACMQGAPIERKTVPVTLLEQPGIGDL